MTATSSERDALLRAILANPAEDTPRLVYADWLTENGQEERGEFIRVQVALAAMGEEPSLSHFRTKSLRQLRTKLSRLERGGNADILYANACRLANLKQAQWRGKQSDLAARARALLTWACGMWFAWPGHPVHAEFLSERLFRGEHSRPRKIVHALFSRGFVSAVDIRLRDWLDHHAAILSDHPVETVVIRDPHSLDVSNISNYHRMRALAKKCGLDWRPGDEWDRWQRVLECLWGRWIEFECPEA